MTLKLRIFYANKSAQIQKLLTINALICFILSDFAKKTAVKCEKEQFQHFCSMRRNMLFIVQTLWKDTQKSFFYYSSIDFSIRFVRQNNIYQFITDDVWRQKLISVLSSFAHISLFGPVILGSNSILILMEQRQSYINDINKSNEWNSRSWHFNGDFICHKIEKKMILLSHASRRARKTNRK